MHRLRDQRIACVGRTLLSDAAGVALDDAPEEEGIPPQNVGQECPTLTHAGSYTPGIVSSVGATSSTEPAFADRRTASGADPHARRGGGLFVVYHLANQGLAAASERSGGSEPER